MNLFAFTRMAEAQLRWSSLNDLIRPQQHRPRDRQPERPGGLQVDDELELRGLLPWKIIGLGALQNLVRAPLASTFPFGGFTRRPIAIDDRLDEGLRLGKLGRGDGDVLPLDPNRRTL
jgi:hypothetical protein